MISRVLSTELRTMVEASEKDIAKGRVYKWVDVKKELGI